VLIHLREAHRHVLGAQPEQVDHHHAARASRQVAPIPIMPNVLLQSRPPTKPEMLRLFRRDDEASPMELHPRRAQAFIREQRLGRRHVHANRQIRV
jgi:hypothetical protein